MRSLSELSDIGGWIPMRVAAGSEAAGVEAISCALTMARTAEGEPLRSLTVCSPRSSEVVRRFASLLSEGIGAQGRPELRVEMTMPVFPSIEAVKSADRADLVVLVCEYRRTARSEAEAAVHRLKQFSGKPVMPVLWGVPEAWESQPESGRRTKSFFARWQAFIFSSLGMSTQEV